jgi:hypothetical protein
MRRRLDVPTMRGFSAVYRGSNRRFGNRVDLEFAAACCFAARSRWFLAYGPGLSIQQPKIAISNDSILEVSKRRWNKAGPGRTSCNIS